MTKIDPQHDTPDVVDDETSAENQKPRGLIEKVIYAWYSIGEVSEEQRAVLLAQDHPGIRIPPPMIFFASIMIGCLIDSPWIYGDGTGLTELASGAGLIGVGMWFILWGFKTQRDAETNVEPWKPTLAIVETGPYHLTRNPMYLGMLAANIGIAMMAGSAWSMATLFVCIIVIDRYVIDREEAYLEEKFGDVYLDYKSRVRRWF